VKHQGTGEFQIQQRHAHSFETSIDGGPSYRNVTGAVRGSRSLTHLAIPEKECDLDAGRGGEEVVEEVALVGRWGR
jgi:hypothetical protein